MNYSEILRYAQDDMFIQVNLLSESITNPPIKFKN
jgi:hypothetical protein